MASPVGLRVLRSARQSLPQLQGRGPARSMPMAFSSFRHASTSSSSSSSLTSSTSSNSSTAVSSSSASANPPNTTRPPPLLLPERAPDASTFSHLLATGKAYLAFYKTGMRYLYTNWGLVRALPSTSTSTSTSSSPSHTPTRSDLLLRRRWQHDVRRLPLFALMLTICGEMTPFVVLLFPHVVPLPCRIPKQVDLLLRREEARRDKVFQEAASSSSPLSSPAVIARSLSLVSPLWDRVGWLPAPVARRAADTRLRYLAYDDALLREAGGVAALIDDEVRLACTDRGLDVRGVPLDDLRHRLSQWLALTRDKDVQSSDDVQSVVFLLTTRPSQWPAVTSA